MLWTFSWVSSKTFSSMWKITVSTPQKILLVISQVIKESIYAPEKNGRAVVFATASIHLPHKSMIDFQKIKNGISYKICILFSRQTAKLYYICCRITHLSGYQLLLLLHTFNDLFSRTTWVSQYQKGKTSLTKLGKRWWGFGMQRHQLDHMQTICTSLQTDNHTNTSSQDTKSNFFATNKQNETKRTEQICQVWNCTNTCPENKNTIKIKI